ncbi:MAG TPA: hypothetical protein VFA89_17070 [Terriglobales bacterium]|nr:hypothetical protein [Terriglobales bacterium]
MRQIHRWLAWVMILTMAMPALGADTNLAVVYPRMSAWVNGAAVQDSLVVFPEDLVQTDSDSVANIDSSGTDVVVQPNSLVKIAVNAVELQRGSVAVGTSKSVAARVGSLTIRPSAAQWTQFSVTNVDGSLKVAARTGEVTIVDEQGSTTLAAGQETTIDQSASQDPQAKKKKKKRAGAEPGASGSIMDSRAAVLIGAGAIVGVTTWVFLQREDPASPYKP